MSQRTFQNINSFGQDPDLGTTGATSKSRSCRSSTFCSFSWSVSQTKYDQGSPHLCSRIPAWVGEVPPSRSVSYPENVLKLARSSSSTGCGEITPSAEFSFPLQHTVFLPITGSSYLWHFGGFIIVVSNIRNSLVMTKYWKFQWTENYTLLIPDLNYT